IASRLWQPGSVEKALSAWSAEVRPLSPAMTYQVIVRVGEERSFLRAELRKALTLAIARDKPRWKTASPAQGDVWVGECQPGRLVAGLRLADGTRRQRDTRLVHHPGALHPTVAALMVDLAGVPRDVLLDPCCGTGTILSEALAAGWPDVQGTDTAPAKIAAARRNVPQAGVIEGDTRSIDLPDESVAAVVSQLPFGQQYEVQGSMRAWMSGALGEITRVTRSGGRVVLLAPVVPTSVMPRELRVARREPIRLLGTKTALWVCDRR
ncbi:MAG: TRM11 family SAM-dependent methyltransferase, partial [Streptosporangiaceae bacterium]